MRAADDGRAGPHTGSADGAAAAIHLDRVDRHYGRTVALDGLTLTVGQGECLALLGPNGAGKTTLVELCEGYARPDAGRVRVLGLDPVADAARLRWRIGIMLQQGGMYPTIRVAELLSLFARFFAAPADPGRLLDAVGLTARRGARVKQLSQGERQRLSLALALVGRPELCFLDEPTSGMDPGARRTTWALLAALRRRGITVVLTTHDLEEAERLADRIAILHHGRLLALDTPEALLGQGGQDRLQVETLQPVDLARMPRLPGVGPATVTSPTGFSVVTADAAQGLAQLTAWLRDEGIRCRVIRTGSTTLEELFLDLTGGGSAPGAPAPAPAGVPAPVAAGGGE
ncbi:MAG TPA: ABC transporter ATP-binding protein [Candidatus Micrarchaeia archaeon]|nr:ABC transporter ATP-binding protein [Candidatus Micrarchaeia archaeon]